MTTKTITTKSGKTIKVELVRKVQDKVSYADGDNIVVGREIVEFTNITFCNEAGKVITRGKEIGPLMGSASNIAAMADRGAVARIGDAAVTQEVVDLINAAFAALEAENPKDAEYLAIKQAKADAHARWEAELPAIMESEAFERRMDDPNSDL